MENLNDLRRALESKCDEARNYMDDARKGLEGAQPAFERAVEDVEGLRERIAQVERFERAERALARPIGFAEALGGADSSAFPSIGDQLVAVMRARNGDGIDDRLIRAPTGAGEIDPSGAGFLVAPEFSNTILTRVYDLGDVASRVFRLPPISGNGIKIPAVDETSRANGSRFGGVSSSWISEGTAPAASSAKFRLLDMDLKKLGAIFYTTSEILSDTALFGAIATLAFSDEVAFSTEDSFWSGSGGGTPLGFMNSPCKVTVPKELGQASKTLVYENITNMYSRLYSRSRQNAAWFINQDVEPQLYGLSQAIGTGGAPVYLPPSGVSGTPYGTLFGRPVIPVEYASTLGTEGDIVLADFSQYVVAEKGGVQMASSMHVQFLTDQTAFRLMYRVDGKPWWHTALTPYHGTQTVSPFVTLASR